MYKNISDYGLIGDMHTTALVSRDGSIDYCSMPHIDSPTVFAALLDDEKGGCFKIQPSGAFESEQIYETDTNILSSTFTSKNGQAKLIDFMPIAKDELFMQKDHLIHRCLKVTSGRMDFKLEISPRAQYARKIPKIVRDGNKFKIKFKKENFTLIVTLGKYVVKELTDKVVIRFVLSKKEEAHFDFIYGDNTPEEKEPCAFNETKEFWQNWVHGCLGEQCAFFGEYTSMINRSLLALKLLTFRPTGAIAAAATTSLPEAIGSGRNWDYRFTWIRDASFTLKAFFSLGHITEADSFIRWLHGIYKKYGEKNLQIMYSLEGKARLKERELIYLKGYKNSRPVRIGNSAYTQSQWDIFGEIMDTALRLSDYAGKIDEGLWPFFRNICNLAASNWSKPDNGIWEVRNGPFHFIYSKVMCWVALDRGIKIAKRYGFDAPISKWKDERNKLTKDIIEKGYKKDVNSFVQHYNSKEIDASLLLLPLMDFLPIDDERIQNTINSCKKNLMKDGFLLRYTSQDGLKGKEGGFVLCNFWLIECLTKAGKIGEAEKQLATTLNAANHLGLFSEQYDVNNNQMLGNFPQAFSHIGYINAVSAILNSRKKKHRKTVRAPLLNRVQKLIPFRVVLNKSDLKRTETDKDIAAQLKRSLNNLQGVFFDVEAGRVNYDAMKKSASYKKYLALAGQLNHFDPFSLKTDDEKKAFWINIYNILIIHGVVDLDIKNSVQEVFNFFGRISYTIGGLYFTPDDIEHGILRGNKSHPLVHTRQFSIFDRRRVLCLKRPDHRIHFALVCASNSCPPIEFYDRKNIDMQLHLAGRSFMNRRGFVLDKRNNILYLSQIFKWYESDFGKNKNEILTSVMHYMGSEAAEYMYKHLKDLKIKYSPYDWNLNRTMK